MKNKPKPRKISPELAKREDAARQSEDYDTPEKNIQHLQARRAKYQMEE